MYNSGVRNNGNLVEYEKLLTENIEYVDKMIKELYKKIDEKFGKLPKVGFFASIFTKKDDHTLLVNYVNKLSEDHRKTKREIAEKVGILTKKSINRNILQASDNSPLKKLEKLYNALQQSTGEFNFEKNLLETPKALDIKVENSLQKVINVKWGEYEKIVKKLGIKSISKSIQNKLEVYEDNMKFLVYPVNYYKNYKKIDLNVFSRLSAGIEATALANESTERKIFVLFVKLLSFKLKSIYFKEVLKI